LNRSSSSAAQHLDAELFGLPLDPPLGAVLFRAALLLFGALRLPVALQNQRMHHRLQRLAVLR
jgi:hypothetical protein